MNFLTPGEKIKAIRKQLGMIQQDLEDANLKRNFVSMIENGERNPGRETARIIARKFNEKAKKLGLKMDLDEDYILATPSEQAEGYCNELLKDTADVNTLDEILEIAEQYGLCKLQSEACIRKGDHHAMENRHEEAFIHYVRALDICKNLKDNGKQAMLFNKLGSCKLNESEPLEAMEYLEKAIRYSQIEKDSGSHEQAVYNMMYAYRKLKKHDRTMEAADQFMKIYKGSELKQQVYAKLIKAEALMGKHEFDKAIGLLSSMLAEYENHMEYFGYIYNELGNVYLLQKKYSKAEECYNKAQDMVEKFDIAHIHANLVDRARLHAKTEELDKSFELLEEGTRRAGKYMDKHYLDQGFEVVEALFDKGLSDNRMERLLLWFLEMIQQLDVKIEKHRIYGRLSLLYLNRNEIEKAKEYLRLSLS